MPRTSRRDVAFTLVELMLSIALVLILLVGVNTVFRTTADAVDAGQFTGESVRDQQALQTVLTNDFANAVKDPPCFIINSRRVSQYLNLTDYQSAVPTPANGIDAAMQTDLDNSGTAGDQANEIMPYTATNFRSHRADTIEFFARGLYHRRTGDPNAFTSSTTAQDAFIWIGHAAQPGSNLDATLTPNDFRYYGPEHVFDKTNAGGTNAVENKDSGLFSHAGALASDWTLGRQVLLLNDPATTSAGTQYYARVNPTGAGGPFAPTIWKFGQTTSTTPKAINLTPLGFNAPSINTLNGTTTQVSDGTTTSNYSVVYLQDGMFDLVGATVEQFRCYLSDAYKVSQLNPPTAAQPYIAWWNPLVYTSPGTYANPPASVSWSNTALGHPQAVPDSFRFAVNATVPAKMTSAVIGRISPALLAHASQFIVEYAGDYLIQDPTAGAVNGRLLGVGQDGQIDYYVDANGNHQIRWYGLPRDANGDGIVRTYYNTYDPVVAAGTLKTVPTINYTATDAGYCDVIPLKDYYYLAGVTGLPGSGQVQASHEVESNFDCFTTNTFASKGSYSRLGADKTTVTPTYPSDARYVCVWRDTTPAMIRILIKVDDPSNRIADGPWFTYVFNLQ